ncbi:NAD(P)-binding protein [Hyphopichia burtonii NRRL Y-1933]|uniref:NAD(P)-binding protein n=1 Tax=Hyphopichia burtonii NRRL Y-1933 TaxID=984485 RepID=A0A1E4RMM9_9ASCO|nr:NAD(P)-binding protein [Hyphopichia burtonii NRRL Y-1933]ODV68513.1 NAD(P)-binding protein [Hyphopichia burtonii NRRL Y-1933]
MTITYFITGANRGIGFEFAKQLSADSNNIVIATTRSFTNAAALKELNRTNLIIIEFDLNNSLDLMRKSLQSIENYSVDVVIQNSGIAKDSQKSILQTTEDELREHYAVNAIGSVKVYQSIFPFWSKKANPETPKKLIFITSGAGCVNNFYPMQASHYGVSKAALNYISRHIAFDHKSSDLVHIKNSIVVAVHPGVVETDMSKPLLPYRESFPLPIITPQESAASTITPEESASSIIKLINGLEQKDNDTFISYDGTRHSW